MPAGGASEELNIGLLLFLPYRALGARIDQALAAAGYGDMTEAQSRIFQRIGAQGSRLTDLAEQAQVTKQTAGILVDQLEALGYVERSPDPDEGGSARSASRSAAARTSPWLSLPSARSRRSGPRTSAPGE